jgi:hypothetical protein
METDYGPVFLVTDLHNTFKIHDVKIFRSQTIPVSKNYYATIDLVTYKC